MRKTTKTQKQEQESLFRFYQPNPLGEKKAKRIGDCTIRAITKIEQISWLEAYDRLYEIGRSIFELPNSMTTIRKYLEKQGYERVAIKAVKGSKRPTIESFTQEHKTGTYLVQVANHVVAVSDGHFFDSWNSGKKSLYSYYIKQESE